MTIEGSSSEKINFGNVDSAVEYINHRPHENFTVTNVSNDIINEIRRRVRNSIRG